MKRLFVLPILLLAVFVGLPALGADFQKGVEASKRGDYATALQIFRTLAVDLPENQKQLIRGGCICGQVRYEIDDKPLGSMICHCRMCQKFSGAPILGGTTILADKLKFVQGSPKFYQSSNIAKRGFCSECGTSLIYQGIIGIWTKWTLVFTASLDEPEKFPPTYHMGIESMMPWLDITDELPRTMSKDSPSLVDAYHAVGEEVP